MKRLLICLIPVVGLVACSSPPTNQIPGTDIEFYCSGPHGVYMIRNDAEAYNKNNYTVVPRDPACPQVATSLPPSGPNPATTVAPR